MINDTFLLGYLPDSLKPAVVTLLHKKDKKDDLKNYRPISLTNYDYKIIAFVLTARLQKVIDDIISKSQTAYIKSRFIGSNMKLICDLIDYCEKFQVSGILLSLDFEKAFDTINWEFMYKCLKKFNFGNNFINWIKILCCDPKIVVKNNGYLSRQIKIEQGLRQGCPVSAILFILCIEILALNIDQNKNIKGFVFGNTELKISQYADDSTLLLKDFLSLEGALKLYLYFQTLLVLNLILKKQKDYC